MPYTRLPIGVLSIGGMLLSLYGEERLSVFWGQGSFYSTVALRAEETGRDVGTDVFIECREAFVSC